ncbi:MAG: DUF4832 domain-containing protein [Scandinavium sp.]|uniref:DUF4832 domain-containing protein n=1 Tax=Scandinavium sp. TaxID=2830653 RepID=UPI003F40EEC4
MTLPSARLLTALATLLLTTSALAANQTVAPPAFNGLLTNPGMGIASFHDGYGEKLSLADYPDTGIEYDRFYWSELEPQEGVYRFDLIDHAFAVAAQHQPAMNVGLRFMVLDEPQSGSRIPDWLIAKGIKGQWVANGKTFVPDLSDPIFLRYAQKLLTAMGQRYDGNPELALVDIGMVGSWGEWHNSNFTDVPPLAEKYTPAQLNRYIDMHLAAFPKTPKIMLISGGESLAYAAQHGAGWRADCWGDWSNFSAQWSHMRDDYPQRLAAAQASYSGFANSWQHAPVSLEICGYMDEWQSVQHYTRQQVQATFDWALQQHASTLNLKSRRVPQEYRDIVDKALLKIGYRYRVSRLELPGTVKAGTTLVLNSTWSNDGVAPVYLPYHVAWRITDARGNVVLQQRTQDDLRQWLPGEHPSRVQFALPASLTAGSWQLEATITDEKDTPRIALANQGRSADGWYPLATFNIEN